ncbi:MAG TPA: hypothetical protein VIU61_28135 [Kofleriaceae bacterium]
MKHLVVLALLAFGCGSDGPDDVVGASCRDDRDCVDLCEGGGDFPGGFCTLRCSDDVDCTSDTICADTHGGVCLFTCAQDSNCDFLGRDYGCRDKVDFYGNIVGVCMGI